MERVEIPRKEILPRILTEARNRQLLSGLRKGNMRKPTAVTKHRDPSREWAPLTLTKAAARYIEVRAAHLSKGRIKTITIAIRTLARILGDKVLGALTLTDLETFQSKARQRGQAPATINTELSALRVILRRANLWHHFAHSYKPLPLQKQIGRAATAAEQLELFRVADRPRTRDTFHAAQLAFLEGMRSCEIRALTWKNVDLPGYTLHITRSKTPAGHRSIVLNATVHQMLSDRFRHALSNGAAEPEHFVFPAVNSHGQVTDPTRPRSVFASWIGIAKQAGVPGLRLHDGRHTAVTTLAEAGIPDQIIMAHVGHVDPAMLAHYSHIRRAAMTAAAEALEPRRMPPAHQTTQEESQKWISPSGSSPEAKPGNQLSSTAPHSMTKSRSSTARSGSPKKTAQSVSGSLHAKQTKATASKQSSSHRPRTLHSMKQSARR